MSLAQSQRMTGSVVLLGEVMMCPSPPGAASFLQLPKFRTWFGRSEATSHLASRILVARVHLFTIIGDFYRVSTDEVERMPGHS